MNEKSLFCPNLFAFVLTAALAGCGSMPPGSESSIVNFHAIDKRGLIYRSGQPDTDADWATLKQLGIKTVIKLNQYVGSHDTLESEQGLADRYGVEVVRHLMQPEDWPVNWNLGAEPDVKEVKATAALLADAREPVLLHCSHGKDRTGLVIAVYRVEQQNWCKSTAYAEMLTYGHNPSLTGIRKVLDSAQIVESQTCK